MRSTVGAEGNGGGLERERERERKQANEAALTSNEVFTPEHFTTAGGFSIFGHNGQKRLRTHTMPRLRGRGSGRRREWDEGEVRERHRHRDRHKDSGQC